MVKVQGLAEAGSPDVDFLAGLSEQPEVADLFGMGETAVTGEVEQAAAVVTPAEAPVELDVGTNAHIQVANCANVNVNITHVTEAAVPESATAGAEPVEQTDEPAAVEPEAKKETPEEAFNRKLEAAKETYTTRAMHVSELESRIKTLKSDLKDAKESCEEAYIAYSALADGTSTGDDADDIDEEDDDSDEDDAVDSAGSEASSATQKASDTNPDAWKLEPIANLKPETIEGMGAKKLEALVTAVPTIGAFEDLRAEAGAMGVHTLLPKGLGRKIADELEERQIAWLQRKWAKAMVSTPDEEGEAPAEAPAQDAADEPQIDEGNPVGEVVERLPFGLPPRTVIEGELCEDQARRRAEELGKATTSPQAPDIDIFREGQRAAKDNQFITDCEYEAGDDQDSWLLGFLSRPAE